MAEERRTAMSNGTMKYASLDLGTIEAVVNKLGGMDGVKRFLSGELVIATAERVFAVWKTIKLGTGLKSAKDFKTAIKQAGGNVSDSASDLLGQRVFTASETETDADLVVVSVAELGFKDGATRADIYTRAQELDLSPCPAEVGPQLRRQYTDQPKGEWLLVAMEPITGSGGALSVFHVGCDGRDLWLHGYGGHADNFWLGDERWVFLRHK